MKRLMHILMFQHPKNISQFIWQYERPTSKFGHVISSTYIITCEADFALCIETALIN